MTVLYERDGILIEAGPGGRPVIGGTPVAEVDHPAARAFVRVYEHLGPIVNFEDRLVYSWLRGVCTPLGGIPGDIMTTPDGLDRVVDYLLTRRYLPDGT